MHCVLKRIAYKIKLPTYVLTSTWQIIIEFSIENLPGKLKDKIAKTTSQARR